MFYMFMSATTLAHMYWHSRVSYSYSFLYFFIYSMCEIISLIRVISGDGPGGV